MTSFALEKREKSTRAISLFDVFIFFGLHLLGKLDIIVCFPVNSLLIKVTYFYFTNVSLFIGIWNHLFSFLFRFLFRLYIEKLCITVFSLSEVTADKRYLSLFYQHFSSSWLLIFFVFFSLSLPFSFTSSRRALHYRRLLLSQVKAVKL